MPILGNMINVKKAIDNLTPYSKTILEDYWEMELGQDLPPMFSDHRSPDAAIVFCDPKLVEEIYTTKSKYMDKYHKFHDICYGLLGDATPLVKSTEKWAQTRKHVSAAFYKENIT